MFTPLVLVGPYAGQTKKLRNIKFVDGKARVIGSPQSLAGFLRYMERSYQAYVEGSVEHRIAAAKWEEDHGEHQVSGTAERGDAETIPSEIQPAGRGTGEESEHPDLGRDDADLSRDPGIRADGAELDGSGSSEDGDPGALTSETAEEPEQVHRPTDGGETRPGRSDSDMTEQIGDLDWTNDEHWTKDGRPAVAPIAAALKIVNLTRARVDAATPEGFCRTRQQEMVDGIPAEEEPAQVP